MQNYSGNPASFPASISVFDDSNDDLRNAANMNASPEALADRTAYLKAQQFSIQTLVTYNSASDWLPVSAPVGTGTDFVAQCATYHPGSGIWLIGGNTTTTPTAFPRVAWSHGVDGSASDIYWLGTSGSSGVVVNTTTMVSSLAVDPTVPFGIYAITSRVGGGGSSCNIYYLPNASGLWVSVAALPSTSWVTNSVFGGNVLFGRTVSTGWEIDICAGGGAAPANVFSSTESNSGGRILFAPNSAGNAILAMPQYPVTAGHYAYSANGSTWSQYPAPSAFAAAYVAGLVYGSDANGACWLAIIVNVTTNQVSVWRTADGANWTANAGGYNFGSGNPALAARVTDVNSAGNGVLIGITESAGGVTPDLVNSRIILSGDAGATWHWVPANLPISNSQDPRLYGSGSQSCAVTGSFRFSHNYGIAAQKL
jgi:hypothetical protein